MKIGDVVRLKSGGPRMTVTGIPQPETVFVSWMVDGFMQSAEYPPDALEPAGALESVTIVPSQPPCPCVPMYVPWFRIAPPVSPWVDPWVDPWEVTCSTSVSCKGE